jgi:hypothetical protein
MSLFENRNFKIGLGVFAVLTVVFILVLSLRKKDNFCKCNSLGSRVMCQDKEEANRLYVNGTLTENNF